MDDNTRYIIAALLAIVTFFKLINLAEKTEKPLITIPFADKDWMAIVLYAAMIPAWIGLAALYGWLLGIFF